MPGGSKSLRKVRKKRVKRFGSFLVARVDLRKWGMILFDEICDNLYFIFTFSILFCLVLSFLNRTVLIIFADGERAGYFLNFLQPIIHISANIS